MRDDPRPLVLHVVHRFDTGGLENGVVNLINHMPAKSYRHAVLALTDVTSFQLRIQRSDVNFVALQKPPGHAFWQYAKLYQIFRELQPHIVHSRNLAALEVQAPAWAAGVPVRIHGEHGRDIGDLDGRNVTLQRVRRMYRPFVHHYTALSRDLAHYLNDKVRVPHGQITQAYNGVDTEHFHPEPDGPRAIAGSPFDPGQHWVVGTVGRMQAVKDQTMLAHAFVLALSMAPELKAHVRLVMVGEGPLRAQAAGVLEAAGLSCLAWFPGERGDIADIMRGLHLFALPSLAEGISNTILEAMASGVPVVATAVGGSADLVVHGETGLITPAGDAQAMARQLVALARDPARARRMGQAGRQRAVTHFSMTTMVSTYQQVYDQQLHLIKDKKNVRHHRHL